MANTKSCFDSPVHYLVLLVFGLVTACLPGAVSSQEKEQNKIHPAKSLKHPWWKAGKEIPFHVVDFIHGTRTTGAGCPAVISKNTKSKAVEIWFRSDAHQALEIASRLSDLLGEKSDLPKYVIGFDITKKEFLHQIRSSKENFSKTQFCIPRNSTRRLFESLDPHQTLEIQVFLIDQKIIKQSFSCVADSKRSRSSTLKKIYSGIKAAVDMN